MDYNSSLNIMGNQISDVILGFFAIYGIVMLLLGLFGLISYIIKGIGMHTIAKREGMEYPWLAFVPFARVYLQGELSGTVQLKNKSIKNPGIWLIALPIISGVIFSVLYTVLWGIFMGTMFTMRSFSSENPSFGIGSVMGIIVVFGIFMLITIVYQAVLKALCILVNHQIYGKFTSKNMSIVHGVMGVFIPFYESICMFVMRNKTYNNGMEPKFKTPFQQPIEQPIEQPTEQPTAESDSTESAKNEE